MKKTDMKRDNTSKRRLGGDFWTWIICIGIVAAVLAGVFVVEYVIGKEDSSDTAVKTRFPEDGTEAALKLKNAGYTVEVENEALLADFGKAACDAYGITFNGSITAYMQVYDTETGESMGEVIYFEYNADAKLLYEKMAADWDKDGEIRCQGKAVYMGYSETLDALEK